MVTVMPYERYVHYRDGKLLDVLEPGKHRLWGPGHHLVPVDTRVQVFEVRAQEVATQDGISVKVSAAAHTQVIDPVAFHEVTEDPHGYLYDAVKAWIRSTVRALTMEEVVAGIEVADSPSDLLLAAAAVGLQLSAFTVRDVLVPGDVRRANEELVTTRQQSQIAMERARSDVAVLRALSNGAQVLEDHPLLASLRLAETAATHGGTVIIERPTP